MKTFFIVTLFQLGCFAYTDAQQESEVTLHGRLVELNLADSSTRYLTDAPIHIWSDDSLVATIYSQEKGRYKIGLPFFHKYRIHYGGGEFISKIVEIDASDFAQNTRQRGYELDIDIILFDNEITGLEFLEQVPFARAAYSIETNSVVWNIEQIEAVDKRVQYVLQNAYAKNETIQKQQP